MSGTLDLLRAAAKDQPLDLAAFDRFELQHALKSGLGPLLYRLSNSANNEAGSSPPEGLHAADLTARLLTAAKLDALEGILRAAGPLAEIIVVLKGMAACLRDYPHPHLRTMGDMDLLVPANALPALESVLYDLGYHQESDHSPEYYESHHHSMPFVHPESRVWVELHTGLFPNASGIAADAVFSPACIEQNTTQFEFRGLTVNVLNDELHLIYTCAHWAHSFRADRGILPLLDIIFALKRRGERIDWKRVVSLIVHSAAAQRVWLLLAWLDRHTLIDLPPGVLARIGGLSRGLDGFNGYILQYVVSRYIVAGIPFGRLATEWNIAMMWDTLLAPRAATRNLLPLPYYLLFPPNHPERFAPGLLLRRLRSVLRTDKTGS